MQKNGRKRIAKMIITQEALFCDVKCLYLILNVNRPVFSIPGYVVHYNQQLLRWLVSFHDLAVTTVDD